MVNIDELARKERLEYFKAWRAANKDKVKKHNDNYWRKKAESKLTRQPAAESENGGKT